MAYPVVHCTVYAKDPAGEKNMDKVREKSPYNAGDMYSHRYFYSISFFSQGLFHYCLCHHIVVFYAGDEESAKEGEVAPGKKALFYEIRMNRGEPDVFFICNDFQF